MTTAGPAEGGRALRRAWATAVLGVGVAAGAAAITLLSLIMRSVTAVGGSCPDDGLYVSAQPCPSGTGTALMLVFACALVCLVGMSWAAAQVRAPLPLLPAWPALFLPLGWNFLDGGFDPPMGEGIAAGYVVCGVVFVLMGTGPPLLWFSMVRERRRTRRAQAERAVPAPAAVILPPWRPAHDPRGPATSVAYRLQRLATLHASGELTDDEYAQAKRATFDEEAD